MYLDAVVSVPDVPGKITSRPKGKSIYVEFEYAREYLPEKKYTIARRKVIDLVHIDAVVGKDRGIGNGDAMKYEIEVMIAYITKDNKDEIRKILKGDVYDVISYSESGELMDEQEARAEFDKLVATARRTDDGSIEVRLPVLVRGEEELEEDVSDDDEPFYYLAEYEEIDRMDFDEESLVLFNEIDL